MPREFSRTRRVADQIQRELADLLLREVSDPRLQGVTVSGVEVSKDLAHARVFVHPSREADAQAIVTALNHAASYLRKGLAGRLQLRVLPRLRFIHDPSLDAGERLDALLEGLASGSGGESGSEPGEEER